MTTLGDIARRVAEEMGDNTYGEATGGSTTTLVDTVMLNGYADDYFNESGIFVLKTTDDAAPAAEFGVISDFDNGTSTATIQTALSAGIGSGDKYMLSSPRYPLHAIIGAVNAALRKMGPIPLQDETLTTASNQTELTIPSGIRDIREVWIQTETGDSDDNQWEKIYGWRIERAAAGSQDTLILDTQPLANRTLKLVYTAEHGDVYAYSDSIANIIDPRYLVARAALHLAQQRVRSSQDSDARLKEQVDSLKEEVQAMQAQTDLMIPPRTARIFTLARARDWPK